MRTDDTVRLQTVFLLKACHGDIRFRSVVTVEGDAMARATQGSLDKQDILPREMRPLQMQLSDQLKS